MPPAPALLKVSVFRGSEEHLLRESVKRQGSSCREMGVRAKIQGSPLPGKREERLETRLESVADDIRRGRMPEDSR